MEKEYLYVYVTPDDFIKITQYIESAPRGKRKQTIITDNGEVRDVTEQIFLRGCFTEKEAEHYITTFRETGFWPHELPDEDEEEENEIVLEYKPCDEKLPSASKALMHS